MNLDVLGLASPLFCTLDNRQRNSSQNKRFSLLTNRHATRLTASFRWALKGAPIDGQRNFSLVQIFSHEIYTQAPWRLTRRAREAMACRTFGRGFFFFFMLLVGRQSRLWELVEDCLRNSYESISQRHGAQRSFFKNIIRNWKVLFPPRFLTHSSHAPPDLGKNELGKYEKLKFILYLRDEASMNSSSLELLLSLSLNGAAIGGMENWHNVWMLSEFRSLWCNWCVISVHDNSYLWNWYM